MSGCGSRVSCMTSRDRTQLVIAAFGSGLVRSAAPRSDLTSPAGGAASV